MKRTLVRTALAAAMAAAMAPAFGANVEYVDEGGRRVAAEALGYRGVPVPRRGHRRERRRLLRASCARSTRPRRARSCPRTVAGLIERGERIEGAPRAGDLLFFDTTGGPSHVGIALDGRSFVHAASEGPGHGRDRLVDGRAVLPRPLPRGAPSPRRRPRPLRDAHRRGPGPGLARGAGGRRDAAAVRRVERRRGAVSPVTVRALVDGKEVLARRLSLSPGREASVLAGPRPRPLDREGRGSRRRRARGAGVRFGKPGRTAIADTTLRRSAAHERRRHGVHA